MGMFNAIYLDIRRLIRVKAEIMKAKTNTDAIILDSDWISPGADPNRNNNFSYSDDMEGLTCPFSV
jgi:hypothetical protein